MIHEKLNCSHCKNVLSSRKPSKPEHDFTRLKEYADDNHLTYVEAPIMEFFTKCEDVFLEREPYFSKCSHILRSLKELLREATPTLPSECHPLKEILCDVFATSRLNMYVKNRKKAIRDAEAERREKYAYRK